MPKAPSLPPQLLIWLGKYTWSQFWHLMMANLAPRSRAGAYLRPESSFREKTIYPAMGRYILLVGMGCPWAHRTLVVRALKGLEEAIAVNVVIPVFWCLS